MARTPKRVIERNLLKVPVLIEDTVSYSKYFEVSRLNPNFHAGKNGFLIRGTQYLKQGSTIQIEVLDRYGKPIYSNIVANYSEGDARLVSVEVTQKTRKGPGKLVVVGTATTYENGTSIPVAQQNSPNVRWIFPIDIDPSRKNISKLILQNTPEQILNNFSVTRTDYNTTSRTDTTVTNTTYTASLDYDFEGHRSDGYAITMVDSSGNAIPFFSDINTDGYFTGSIYKREIRNLYDTGVLVPDSQSVVLDYVTASVYTPLFKTLNETLAITEKSIKFNNGDDYLNPLLYSGSYSRVVTSDDLGGNLVRKLEEEITSSVTFQYPTETLTTSANNSSILNFRIPYTTTHTGEIAKVRINAKEANPEITSWQLLTEFTPGERNILITDSNTGNVSVGRFLQNSTLQDHWQAGLLDITDYENSESVSNPRTLVTSSAEILEGFYVDHTSSAVPYFFGTKDYYQLYKGVEYTLKYDAVYNPSYVSSSTTYSTTDVGSLKAYLTRIGSDAESRASSSVVIATKNGVTNTYGLLVDEVTTKDNDKALYERQVNFTPERDGVAYLRFIVDNGFWNFSNFVITPSVEYGYNPDEIVVYAEDTIIKATSYLFKIEFIGWDGQQTDEFVSDIIEIPEKITGEAGVVVLFELNPPTQAICRDTGDAISDPIPDITVTGFENEGLLAYNAATPVGAGYFKITNVYGIPTSSGGVTWDSSGSISIDYTKVTPTSSATFTGYVDIEFTASTGVSGSRTRSFTLTKQNCYDPCSAVYVDIYPSSQLVSRSADLTIEQPIDFRTDVIQDSETFTYDSNPSLPSNKTFQFLTLHQTNTSSLSSITDNGDGTITPAVPNDINPSNVYVDVKYKNNCGQTGIVAVTHSIQTVLDGDPGPGLVFRGLWTGSAEYTYSSENSRRDVVLWSGSGELPNVEINGYYAALQTNTNQQPTSGSTDTYWEFLGVEDFFVAAKFAIFQESYVYNTINVGTNTDVPEANITIYGGSNYPYISIGQTSGQAYSSGGIWLGKDEIDEQYKLSLSGSYNSTGSGLFFDGQELTISGSIQAQSGDFTGTVNVGNKVFIGPSATTNALGSSFFASESVTRDLSYSGGPTTSIPITDIVNFTAITSITANQLYTFEINFDDIQTDWTVTGGSPVVDATQFTEINVLFISGSTITKSENIFSGLWSSGDVLPSKTIYYTPTFSDDLTIRLQYTGSLENENLDDFVPATQTLFSASYTASALDTSVAIRGDGIFIDQGYGAVNILELIDPTAATPSSLQQVTNVGSSTTNAITIVNGTNSTSTTTGALIVSGGIGIGGDGYANDWIATSDIRLKNVESYVSGGLIMVNNLTPIRYTWADGRDAKTHIGFSAQDVLNYVPEAVYGSEQEHYGISYGKLVPVLVDAIKELTTRIEQLEKQLEDKE